VGKAVPRVPLRPGEGNKDHHRYGVIVLAVLAGVLLIAVNAVTDRLIPRYAIGVFTGFTISQTGLVRHLLQDSWTRTRPGPAPPPSAAVKQPGDRAGQRHQQAH
jgi:hypothetical protein